MAEAFRNNMGLQKIYLDYNNIGADVATTIAEEALKSNSTLQQLGLRGNNDGIRGATALTEALKTNFTLHILDFWNNNISDIVDNHQIRSLLFKENREFL